MMEVISPDNVTLPGEAHAEIVPVLRHDEQYVRELVHAIVANDGEAPEGFFRDADPIVVDQDGLVINGRHRVLACRHEGVSVRVARRTFDSIADRLLAAAEANAEHGRRLTRKEQARFVSLCESLGIEQMRIAHALRVPVSSVERAPIVKVVRRDGSSSSTYIPVPARQRFKRRTEITESEAKQLDAIQSPLHAVTHCRELCRLAAVNALGDLDGAGVEVVRDAIAVLKHWLETTTTV